MRIRANSHIKEGKNYDYQTKKNNSLNSLFCFSYEFLYVLNKNRYL